MQRAPQRLTIFRRVFFPESVIRAAIATFREHLEGRSRFEASVLQGGFPYPRNHEDQFFREYRRGTWASLEVRHIPGHLSKIPVSALAIRILGGTQTEVEVRHEDAELGVRIVSIFEAAQPRAAAPRPLMPRFELKPRIFLAYGRRKEWKSLSEALARHSYQIIEFDSAALPGVGTYEHLRSMVFSSDFAVIMMLGELEIDHPQAGSARIPRLNVILELGFALAVFDRKRVFTVIERESPGDQEGRTSEGQAKEKEDRWDQLISDVAAFRRVHFDQGARNAAEEIHRGIRAEMNRLQSP